MTTTVTKSNRISRNRVLQIFGLSLLQIGMTILLISFLVPALWMISSSLKSSTEIFKVPQVWIPEDPQWSNFADVFNIPSYPFATFIWNTVTVVFWAVLGTVLSSAFVAYAFSRLEWPGRNFFFSLLVATILILSLIHI